MKNNVFRKGLVLAIIVLFVGAGVIPSISGNILGSLKTIYVDDDNTGGPWDRTQANPYQYIQDGIDASSNDDTVFVYGGTYNENVVVDKSIDLEGENKQTTIIDGGGSGDVVQIAEMESKVTVKKYEPILSSKPKAVTT